MSIRLTDKYLLGIYKDSGYTNRIGNAGKSSGEFHG